MVKKKIIGTTTGHLDNSLPTTGHSVSSSEQVITEEMKNELITKLKTCIEENTNKNNTIYDIVTLIKQDQTNSH